MEKMFYVFSLCSAYSMLLFVSEVEGPLSRSFSSMKLGMDDPCADEKVSEKTPRSLWHVHRSSEQPRQPRSYTLEVIHAAANRFFREFEYQEALRCYHKAVDRNFGRYAKVYRNRGLCFSRLSLHDKAILDYETSLDLEPESVRGRYFLGREYLVVGRLDESKTELKRALKYGDEQNMINDEKVQIKIILNKVRLKKKEMEKEQENVRRKQLFEYLKDLMFEDAKRKVSRIKDQDHQEEDADEKVNKIVSNLEEYLNELKDAFFTPRNLQPASVHEAPHYLVDRISLGIMRDPVITPSGISYENAKIRQHLETREILQAAIVSTLANYDRIKPYGD